MVDWGEIIFSVIVFLVIGFVVITILGWLLNPIINAVNTNTPPSNDQPNVSNVTQPTNVTQPQMSSYEIQKNYWTQREIKWQQKLEKRMNNTV